MAVITLGVLVIVLAVSLVLVVRFFLTDQATRDTAYTTERRELLNRIQRPEYVPNVPVGVFEIPELEPDDVEEVGTIKYLDPDAE